MRATPLIRYPADRRLLAHCRTSAKERNRQVYTISHEYAGISIVEVLIAIIISSFAVMVSASIIGSLGANLRSTENVYDTQNAIDQNLSAIESAADRYKCSLVSSALSCTVTSGSSIPAKDAYIDVMNATAWPLFIARCNMTSTTGGADLISPLKSFIEGDSSLNVGGNAFRQITVHGADSAQGLTYVRHMTVQYREGSASGKILRDVTIMPTIVSYCP